MWQLYALIMYLSSVIMYLLIRGVKKTVHPQVVNFFMFVPGTVFLFLVAISRGDKISIDPKGFLLLTLATFFFSYLGNTASLQAIKNAPNAGYSLVLQKSYAIYTSIAAIFLFSSNLAIDKFIVIIISSIFLVIVAMSDKTKANKSSEKKVNWIFESLTAFFLFGNLSLFSKYMLGEGYEPLQLTFYVFLLNFIIQGVKNRKILKTELKGIPRNIFASLIIIGILSALFNLFMRLGIEIAPNLGYVNTINASSIAMIAVLSKVFFKDELSLKKFIGIVGATLGVVYIVLA